MAGTARDEAERLVAAVLAMAGSAGGADGAAEKAADRVTAGLVALGDTVSNFLGGLSANPGDDAERAAKRPDDLGSSGGERDSGGPRGGTTGGGLDSLSDAVSGFLGGLSGGEAQRGRNGSGGARHQGGGWATGSAECCVCPVCRVISTMRDPSPETAIKLAMGAGDLATGVASMMRAFSSMTGSSTTGRRTSTPPAARPRPENRDENWSTATRTTNRPGDAWSAATNPAPRPSERKASDPAATATDSTSGPIESTTADTAAGDSWAAATGVSAAAVAAEHEAEVAARAARRAAEQAAQREAARAASQRAKEAAARVAEAVRLAEAARDSEGAGPGAGVARAGARTPRKRDVWAAATADAGVAAVGGGETLDHDGHEESRGVIERGDATGGAARGDDAV